MDCSESFEAQQQQINPQQQPQQQQQQQEAQLPQQQPQLQLQLQQHEQGDQQQQQQQQMQCDHPSMVLSYHPPAPPNLAGSKIPTQTPPSSSADIEIDSLLLQQFSCLGTTDHEDLISQFQSLMNNQVNKDSARFFLEMSNWNLQTAVGCYLDYCNFQNIPSMKIIQQTQPSEYQQAWRLQNDGTEDWPNGCYLMSPSQTRRFEIPGIKPGDTCDILAEIPPTQPAVMWRVCTPNGWYFGDTIWMIPPGSCNTQAELAVRMSQLRTSSNSTNPECIPQVNVVISVNSE